MHLRGSGDGKHNTLSDHMPSSHRRYGDWTIERILREARAIGPSTERLCQMVLEEQPHPEQGFRTCLGVVRLVRPHRAQPVSRPPAAAPWRSGSRPTARSSRSWTTTWMASPRQAPARSDAMMGKAPHRCTPTSVDPATTIEETTTVLTHPTLDQLNVLGLQGMAKAFTELNDSDQTAGLRHAEWLALLLDREAVHRHDKQLGARLRSAKLRYQACPEDIDYRAPRGLDRRLMQELLKGDWITARTWRSPGRPALANPGWPARLAIRPAATTTPSSTSASPNCSTTSPWPTATAASAASRRWAPSSS